MNQFIVVDKNFIECDTIEEANNVDLEKYTFLDRMSGEKGKYCFKIRQQRKRE